MVFEVISLHKHLIPFHVKTYCVVKQPFSIINLYTDRKYYFN